MFYTVYLKKKNIIVNDLFLETPVLQNRQISGSKFKYSGYRMFLKFLSNAIILFRNFNKFNCQNLSIKCTKHRYVFQTSTHMFIMYYVHGLYQSYKIFFNILVFLWRPSLIVLLSRTKYNLMSLFSIYLPLHIFYLFLLTLPPLTSKSLG